MRQFLTHAIRRRFSRRIGEIKVLHFFQFSYSGSTHGQGQFYFAGALLIIEILKLIPRNRLITASEIRNSLFSAGYDIPIRTLQRYLKSISETESLHVECDSRSKPYGYRRSSPKSEFADLKLTPEESLLLSLAGQYLQYLLPTTISTSLSQVFDAARDQLFSHPAATRRLPG